MRTCMQTSSRIQRNLGVNRIEGDVKDVIQDSVSGFIKELRLSDGSVVNGDFFIDCTGFKGSLLSNV